MKELAFTPHHSIVLDKSRESMREKALKLIHCECIYGTFDHEMKVQLCEADFALPQFSNEMKFAISVKPAVGLVGDKACSENQYKVLENMMWMLMG